MKVEHDISLKKYTTLKIGGNCKNLYFPDTAEELKKILADHPNAPLLGGGSNLLINDQTEFLYVICLRNLEKDLLKIGEEVLVGAGVRLQILISEINAAGYGGIEYLFSVPGLVGGAIYMNAGRGRGANKQISDYLISVDVLENGEIKTMTREQCCFDYRTSVFHSNRAVILRARFRFDRIDPEDGKKLQRERIEICKTFQDSKYPNAGTTFCQSDPRIMNWVRKLSSKKAEDGVHFSNKCNNWLQNRGEGTYRQAKRLLDRVAFAHKLMRKPCKLEYKVWE